MNVTPATEPPMVVYHAGCPDGFTAAWSAHLVFGDEASYRPAVHGNRPPTRSPGQHLYILDFSYSREVMAQLIHQNPHITLLDHHQTAAVELASLAATIDPTVTEITIDQGHSGAHLAWRHFHPDRPAPALVNYVEDRDLWRSVLPDSRPISALIGTRPTDDFKAWSELAALLEDNLAQAVILGVPVLEYQRLTIRSAAANAHTRNVGGYVVHCVNSPVLQSELGELLQERYPDDPFVGIYHDTARNTVKWSLRANGGFDVSQVAGKYGGGGHRPAAGFEVRQQQSPRRQHP